MLYDIFSCGVYSLELARLGPGQGKAMKARTNNECVLHLILIGLHFSCHVFLFKSMAM